MAAAARSQGRRLRVREEAGGGWLMGLMGQGLVRLVRLEITLKFIIIKPKIFLVGIRLRVA
jgi:hypothetical protein